MIIIEGIDGVGKTTLVDYFVEHGMQKYHFDYDVHNMDLYTKYMRVLDNETESFVFDRSFISEMVYGPVLRNHCKLTLEQYKNLLLAYKQCGTSIIYLTSPKSVLLSRRINDLKDYEMIDNHYDSLNEKYDEIMSLSQEFIDVMKCDSHMMSKEEIQEKSRRFLR